MTYTETAAVTGADEAATAPARETKGERTRRRLLEQAIDSFGEHGYRGTSVSEVARSIGLTQAATYAYFDSKNGLYRAAADADAERLITEAQDQLEGLPVRQLIPALVAQLVAGLDDHPLARRVISGDDAELLDRLVGLPVLDAVVDELAVLLAAEQVAGTVRADIDPALMARGVQTIILGLVMSAAQLSVPPRPETVLGVVHALDALVRPLDELDDAQG